MSGILRLGFVGLGVMGGAMATNLVKKSGARVAVYDIDAARVDEVCASGATRCANLSEVATSADVVFLSLPGFEQVSEVVLGDGGLGESGRAGQVIVDMSTSPVELARRLSRELEGRGIAFVDAPVARGRQAAIDGTLSVMVGCDRPDLFGTLGPYFFCMAEEVSLCGGVGAGALVKLLNNMIVFETVVALSEAITVLRHSDFVDPAVAFEVLGKGSAASFALENHGKRALLVDEHPTRAFSSRYMAKDVGYALDFARSLGLVLPGATLSHELLEQSIEAGNGERYHTSVVSVIEASLPES